MKIAVIGRAPSARQAPVADPEWTVWGMAWAPPPRWDRLFDIHSRRLRAGYGGSGYKLHLDTVTPLTMLHDPLPHADEYPLAAVKALVGEGVLTSSVAYMLAAAILAKPLEIGLWGIELTASTEYQRQRPSVHFLLGVAKGQGIAVTLPPGCPLFPNAPDYGA
ncbi:hypothetical protein [Niveispirillum sp.]|uniref:hypothetical protein n=1 Tax=Niveispirillum sp. TaxID=1917217 RepID=UPI001B5983B9|nr:hypothetical protein [Niveispirillum sp.]MBP7339414.1 hypothetical protein [Niveispirillum sp.]